MAGDGTTTTRFGFRELGSQTVLEPGPYNTHMDYVDANLPASKYSTIAAPGTAGSGLIACCLSGTAPLASSGATAPHFKTG